QERVQKHRRLVEAAERSLAVDVANTLGGLDKAPVLLNALLDGGFRQTAAATAATLIREAAANESPSLDSATWDSFSAALRADPRAARFDLDLVDGIVDFSLPELQERVLQLLLAD